MKTPLRTTMFAALALALAATGCKDDKKADPAGTPGSPTAKEGGKPAAGGAVAIDAYGLVFDGPSGATVSEMLDMQMVQAPGLVFSVDGRPDHTDKTLEGAVEDSKMYDGKITKQDKTADGYHLEFNNTGSMGANYFVEILRTVGDKKYLCTTTVPDAASATAAAKACLSLRAK